MNRTKILSLVFAGAAAAIGLVAIAGWLSQLESLKTGMLKTGGVSMNPMSSVAFLLASASICLLQNARGLRNQIGRMLGAGVAAIGLVKLVDCVLGHNSGIDQLLFASLLDGNRMAPNTAAGFVVLGSSIMLRDVRIGRRLYPGDALAAATSALGLLCLVGYIFGARAIYGVGSHIPMALNSALAFELLGLGILCGRPDRGIVAIFLSSGLGGAAARRLLPVAVTVPVALGCICRLGERVGLYDVEFCRALMVTASVLLLVAAVYWTALVLNDADRRRRLAEQQLRLAFDELEVHVSQRTAELVEANLELEQKNQDVKQAAQDLQQRDDQLRQAQRMEAVGTLAGGVAHEFNNLLQAMQAYTKFALEGLDPQEQRFQDLQQVIIAADRATALTRQLLGFGRRQTLELANVHPNTLMQDLVKLVRPLIGANIEVQVSLDENVAMIHADAGQFQQLLMNLCVNARDAMPDGGTLWVTSEDLCLSRRYCDVHPGVEPGRYLAITVSDTGTGMPPEVIEHIFEPFYTTKGVGKGTGLGLSMVYGLVQQHHGVIRVYSEIGLGTTFKIYLPVVEGEQVVKTVEAVLAAAVGTETILVADDEPLVHDVYVRVLGKAGYRLLTARDGREAWDVFLAHQDEIDLLLLDVVMPHQSGREVQRKIDEIRPNVPAIFCSGYDPETARVRFAEGSEFPFLQKPFDPDALLRLVRQVLDKASCPETLCSI